MVAVARIGYCLSGVWKIFDKLQAIRKLYEQLPAMRSGVQVVGDVILDISPTLRRHSVLVIVLLFFFNGGFLHGRSKASFQLPPVPTVRGGLPMLGNLLQLKEKKPIKTFTRWAEIYGPIYSIKLGSSRLIVLNSMDLAKEALITRFSSITNKKLSLALRVVSGDQCMTVASDYNDFYKTVKRFALAHHLGSNALKAHQGLRESMLENLVSHFNAHTKDNNTCSETVNFRDVFVNELFGFALKLALGRDVQCVDVEELGTTLSRKEIFHALVVDMMDIAVEVDWREFFPSLSWVPNNLETKLKAVGSRRLAVMKALIKQSKRETDDSQEKVNSYLEFLESQAEELTDTTLAMLVWEPILQTSDSPAITTEWAIFELAKDRHRQEQLHKEIRAICGTKKVTEDDLSQLPYLCAVFHETMRKHSPLPILPIRNVDKDTEIGGYRIPAGSEIAVNIYGCNRNKSQWKDPEEWRPERFVEEKCSPSDLYKTMGFGAGKRACIGASLAMILSSLSIGRLVQEFEWSLRDGEEEDVDTVGITTHKLNPLHVHVKQRSQ